MTAPEASAAAAMSIAQASACITCKPLHASLQLSVASLKAEPPCLLGVLLLQVRKVLEGAPDAILDLQLFFFKYAAGVAAPLNAGPSLNGGQTLECWH
jgi:hypothetical protein